jgi:hypothetical protein
MKKALKIFSKALIVLLALCVIYYTSLWFVFSADMKNDYAAQEAWINELTDNPRAAVNEQNFADFDLNSNTLRLNEVQVLATHNSFKAMPNMYINGFVELFGGERTRKGQYGLPKLYDQLDSGIRGLEIDVTMYDGKITTVHDPITDWRTNTTDFRLALEEIRLWSDNNPNHYPLNIMVQVRDQWSPFTTKYSALGEEGISDLDALFEEVFGGNIITPAIVKGDADSLREAVTTTGWPLVTDCMGKVYFTLLFSDQENLDYYVALDPEFETQNGFIMTNPKEMEIENYTAVILADDPFGEGYSELVEEGYLLRTRIDEQWTHPEDRRAAAIALGSVILATDYPKNNSYPDGYICELKEGYKTIIARN